MEELDLKELFNIFWSKKIPIILLVLIFAVLGFIYTMTMVTPMYTASTTLVLASSHNEDGTATSTTTNSITTADVTLNSNLVSTYSELVKSKNVLRQVISNLGIDISEESLRNNVSVKSVQNTELIEITVTTQIPEYASKIANEIAKVFIENVKEYYGIENLHVVDEAEVEEQPANINHIKDIVIFGFIGIVVASMYVLIVNMLDTTIKSSEDIEKITGVTVLASIPIYETIDEKPKSKRRRRRGGAR